MNAAVDTPALWSAYRDFDRDRRIRHAKAGCILALILMPAGMTLDYFVYPQWKWQILESRFITDAFILPVFLLLFTQLGRHWIKVVGSLWALFCAAAISWMIWLTEGVESPYYAGLNLVILITCNLMPYTIMDAMVVCGLTIGMYTLAILLHHGHPMLLRDAFNNYYFLVLTAIISVTACGVFNRGRIEDFRLRHRLDLQNQELNDSYSKLAELDRLRSQFFANISHELRTPLTLILAPIEDLLRSSARLPDKVSEALGIARANALRLLKLINDLLEVVRVDEKMLELRREPIELGGFARGVAESVRMLAEAQGLTLAVEGDRAPLAVSADPARLEKVLLNLLTNAIKFTPNGGRIAVSWRLEREAGPQGTIDTAVVEVADTGVGIPAAEIPHIFDRFRQVDGSSTRKYQGAGIGLALARDLVAEHGGTLVARSVLGKGTTLEVRLPIAAGVAAPAAAPTAGAVDPLQEIYRAAERRGGIALADTAPPEEQGPAGRVDGPTVLVVDDEPDMRRYIVSRLVETYRVLQSDDGARALELAKRERPDLIVLDFMMPGLDGLQVCRALRADPELAETKVILLTARADEPSKIESLRGGADDFLTKPFSTLELVTRIAGLLRTGQLQRALRTHARELELAMTRLKDTETQLVQSEKMSALGTISAGLLHEVNNPLNFTIQALQVALRSAPEGDRELRETLGDIGEGMRRVKDIVNDLGMFAYKSNGHDSERFELEAVVDSSLRLASHELAGITVTRDLPAGMPVVGSRTQLSHVFMNLLVNSTKALKGLAGREPAISISARPDGARLRVTVRDNGCGIAPEVLPRIFEPFFTTRSVGQGMGLGLSISHTIIANHGGQILARSERGQWTEIEFDLPLAGVAQARTPEQKELVR
jgi:signal transduction histidine kinase